MNIHWPRFNISKKLMLHISILMLVFFVCFFFTDSMWLSLFIAILAVFSFILIKVILKTLRYRSYLQKIGLDSVFPEMRDGVSMLAPVPFGNESIGCQVYIDNSGVHLGKPNCVRFLSWSEIAFSKEFVYGGHSVLELFINQTTKVVIPWSKEAQHYFDKKADKVFS